METNAAVLIDIKKVTLLTGLSKPTIYRKMKMDSIGYDPTFPKRKRAGSKKVMWLQKEIIEWINKLEDID